MKLLYFFAAEM